MHLSASHRIRRWTGTMVLGSSLLAVSISGALAADGWLWDRDGDRIDDRIEAVEQNGIAAAYENLDPASGRLRFAVGTIDGATRFGVYVGYDHEPTQADLDRLAASGVSTAVLHPYEIIDYVRMELTFDEIETVAGLPGVTRVESIPMLYPVNNNATKTTGVKPSNFKRFPTVHEDLGITGEGVVVSILDTGVNDQADLVTGFPGHESFEGKFLGGGNFFAGDPNLNTPNDQSENPIDRGEAASSVHGTHVAGTTLGTGGASGIFSGVAPGSLLVDQKVLSDAGAGFGSADGVEWAVANKDKFGIRVLNLSLGGLDSSDGTDAGSQAINAAFDAGIVAAVATGNDGNTNHISSPSAADKALSIGALADQNTITRDDDRIADFSNEGPRLDDGDGDFTDEMKPLVAGPGAGTVSADGSLATDGRQYKPLSGTSMSTPHVAGVIALMLEANPSLTPQQIVDVLKHTSEHRFAWGKTAADANPFPAGDPNYHPSGGWGQVDGYAAVKEALRLAGDPASQTQVVFIHAEPAADGSAAIDVTWKSQRETGLDGYNVYRAPDVNGAPGTFTQVNASLIPGSGQERIEGVNNRNTYTLRDSADLSFGQTYWYRIEHVSTAGTFQEPPLAVTLGQAQPVARLKYSITHDAYSNDLLVLLGTGPQFERPDYVADGLSPEEADSVTTEAGDPTTGTQRYEFVQTLTTRDDVAALLPPSEAQPWFLSVKEGGFVNRVGRVNSFSLEILDAEGNVTQTYTTADPTPQQTVETQTTNLWIPDNPEITLPGESPTVSELDPDAAAQGAQGVAVSIFGAEFLPGATVSLSGSGVTVDDSEVVRGTQIDATLSIDAGAAAGPRDVTVANADGESHTAQAAFTVIREGDGGGDVDVTKLDDADPAVEYRKGWHRKDADGASNGGYHRRMGSPNGNGGSGEAPSARLVFEGNQVTYFYGVSEVGGSADVFIDGELRDTVSYAGDASRQHPQFGESVTYDGLADGRHEILVRHRDGAAYVDGFQVGSNSGSDASADESAARSRSVTSVFNLEPLGAGNLSQAIELDGADESVSVLVEGGGSPLSVTLLDPQGNAVASGEALLDGMALTGLDAPVSQSGTYTVLVGIPLTLDGQVGISVARTVPVN